jgi:hypothetical protein
LIIDNIYLTGDIIRGNPICSDASLFVMTIDNKRAYIKMDYRHTKDWEAHGRWKQTQTAHQFQK